VKYCGRSMRGSVSLELISCVSSYVRWADIVHLHAAYSFPTIPTLSAARILDRPLVWSPRGAFQRWPGSRRRGAKHLWEAICRLVAPRRLVIQATSAEEAKETSARFPAVPVQIVPNGVYPPGELRRVPGDGTLRLAFLGRLDPKKGVENLFSACRMLSDRGQLSYSLAIAGTGKKAYLEALGRRVKRLGIASRVSFFGEVLHESKERFFASTDVLLVPSYTENFGNVVSEALVRAVPVIASTGTPWSRLEEMGCGLWVDNGPESLAGAVERISRMALDEMGQRGRNWMLSEFSWQRCTAEMLACYRRVLAGGNSTRR